MNKLIFESIEKLLLSSKKIIIAIDGMCASGKTTLAKEIQENFGGSIISADDFFLPFEMRSEERLNTPGGNFHRERFKEEVINNLDKDKFSYGVFDCSLGKTENTKEVEEKRLVIIEGSYCMHPELNAEYDLKIFTLTDFQTQLERIEKRNGTKALEAFKNKWIPVENMYFSWSEVREKSDAVLIS